MSDQWVSKKDFEAALRQINLRLSALMTRLQSIQVNTSNGFVGICGPPNTFGYELEVHDDFYADGIVSALLFIDRTPYPKDKQEAYDAILSLESIDGKIDHGKLHPSIRVTEKNGQDGRDLSALVSAQNEVIKDLVDRIKVLEKI